MSTPEQLTIIRHVIQYRELRYADKERELTDALIAVLRDAERFKALERAHKDFGTSECWAVGCGGDWHWDGRPLSELADRLKEGGEK